MDRTDQAPIFVNMNIPNGNSLTIHVDGQHAYTRECKLLCLLTPVHLREPGAEIGDIATPQTEKGGPTVAEPPLNP